MHQSITRAVRTLLVSDVHLGCKHAQTDEFLKFLRGYRPDNLYLVGDFLDAWKINSGWNWDQSCDDVIAHVIEMAKSGTKVFYTPGNHDAFLRQHHFQDLIPNLLPHCEIKDEFIFQSARGYRFLVTHGDLFDLFETKAQWISKASSFFYDTCLATNRLLARRGRNPYGVCGVLKNRVKNAVKFVSSFESKLFDHATHRQCDGVVCGHIHTPAIIHSSEMLYLNTGDWVENCTGLVEHHDGRLELASLYSENLHLQLEVMAGSEAAALGHWCVPDAGERKGMEPGRKEYAASFR